MDHDDIFKYQRIKGQMRDTFEKKNVTACCLDENAIIIGTSSGIIYLFTLAGKLMKNYQAHEGAVNDIAVDCNGLAIYSCCEDGSVVTNSMAIEGDEKETVLAVDESLKVLCTGDSTPGRKDKSSFIVGTAFGRLILHKQAWFAKDVALFSGSGSSVCAVAWRGDVVAWADASQVRLMDVTTQVAICYLNSPTNVGPSNPFPCKLFWESEYDLIVGWADNVRHLQLVYASAAAADSRGTVNGRMPSADADIRARLIADWNMDTVVCGISSFDPDHILVLGYMPPTDDLNCVSESDHTENKAGEESHVNGSGVSGPELLLMRRSDGTIVSADVLPLVTSGDITPDSFGLISNYTCFSRRSDYLKWSINAPSLRGGFRGFPPVSYIVSGHDIVVSKVRDVNDRITTALQMGDLKTAVDLAHNDKNMLRVYQYHDLVKAYINSLFNADNAELAAKECARLIQHDSDSAVLWESWIFEFANRKRLSCIAPFVPIDNPRLPNSVYEVILSNFLFVNTHAFLSSIRKWGSTKPPLFDAASLIKRVVVTMESRQKERAGLVDPWLLEAKAYLHTLLQQYQEALQCYLEVAPSEMDAISFSALLSGTSSEEEETRSRKYQYVFDLIEKQNLFESIQDQILKIVKLCPKLARGLLLRNVDKLPVMLVVKQLRDDSELLHWYLHALFKSAPDMYNNQEYAELHLKQVSLYAHFAHAQQQEADAASLALATDSISCDLDRPLINPHDLRHFKKQDDSDFLQFLKYSNFVSLEVALRECERQQPPLYREIIFILAKMGNVKEGLGLLLRELGDVHLAVEYVEIYDTSLWEDVVNYGLTHHGFLAELMDLIGMYSKFNPLTLVDKLPPCMEIPLLRQRLVRLLQHCEFQEFLQGQNRAILQDDTVTLLRRLNRGQRKAVKLNSSRARCAGCGRPISIPPPSRLLEEYNNDTLPQAKSTIPIWGLPGSCGVNANGKALDGVPRANLVVFLPNKIAYHRLCFDSKACADGSAVHLS